MPIYTYECPNCGISEEQVVNKSENRHKAKCSQCGHGTKLVISRCTFRLKGSGWYVTDYKNASGKKNDKS